LVGWFFYYRTYWGRDKYVTISSVMDSAAHGSPLILVGWIRIQEGKNDPQKIEKREEISDFEVLDILF
jgi:hypothetical protein